MAQVVIFTDSSRQGIWVRGIGPYSLATYTRNKGYTVEVVDFISGFGYKDFEKFCQKYINEDTILVGISTTWISAPKSFTADLKKSFAPNSDLKEDYFFNKDNHNVYYDSFSWALTNGTHKKFTDCIRSYGPNCELVVGGARAIEFNAPEFDRIVLGYSENQLVDILEKKRILPRIVNHDIKAEKGDYEFHDSSQTIYQDNDFLLEDETLPIEIGRGCIFQCKYCSFPLIGKKKLTYTKDPILLKDEFQKNWEKHKIRRYIISDDTFNDSNEKLQLLAKISDDLDFDLNFWCFARLDLISKYPEQIDLLHKIGIKEIQFGIESFHEPSAKTIGKGGKADRKKQTLQDIKKVWGDDVHTKCSFIVGLPHETRASLEEHYTWLESKECPIDSIGINPLFIAQPDEWSELRWRSEFDKTYDQYGYYFDNPRHMFDWKKDDDTDIKSFDEAIELYMYWNNRITDKKPSNTESFYYANTKALNLKFEDMFHLNREIIFDFKFSKDWKQMYLDQVKNMYVDPKLKS